MYACVVLLFAFSAYSAPILPANSWPSTWHSWLVTTVVEEGKNASMVKGQLVLFDLFNQYTCRYKQESLQGNATRALPTDICDYKAGFHYRVNDTTGDNSKCDIMVPLNDGPIATWSWPVGLREQAKYLGTDHVAQKDCDHYLALNFQVSGIMLQMDVWVANDTGFPCQIHVFEINANPRIHFNWAFDGFSDVIPPEAIICSAPEVVCAKQDWTCDAIAGSDQDDLGAALQWVCGPNNVNCDPLNPGGANFQPNTVLDHCNWAFNSYFQKYKAQSGEAACQFQGVGHLVPPKNNPPASKKKYILDESRKKEFPIWSKSMDFVLSEAFGGLLYPIDLLC